MKIRFADFELNDQNYHLRRSGVEVRLRPKVFDLLVQLVRNRDRVVRREELVDALWGGTRVGTGSLSGLVNELRGALGEEGRGRSSIRTVHARGYQFVAEVHEIAEGAIAPGSVVNRPSRMAEMIERVARRGFAGAILAGEQEAVAHGLAELEAAASTAHFEVIRVEVPHESSGALSRFPRDLIRAMVGTRGQAAVESRLPLPARDWLVRDGAACVAGGQAGSTSSPPDGYRAAAQMLSGLALCRPVLLFVGGLPAADLRFLRELGRFVSRLGDAPVLCAVGDSAVGTPGAWRRVLEQEVGFELMALEAGDSAGGGGAAEDVLSELPPLLTDALVAHAKGDRHRVVRLLERVHARTPRGSAMKTVTPLHESLRSADEEAC